MKTRTVYMSFAVVLIALFSVSFIDLKESAPAVIEQKVTYTVNGKQYDGYIAYDQNIKGKRPSVIVVPEWWGLNEYPRTRAKQLAELGYFAMAIDMFGGGVLANDPEQATRLTIPYYDNPTLCKTQLDAAIDLLKGFEQSDNKKVAAIGYCFGGFVVLNAAKLGSDLKGVVSFHGGLGGAKPVKDLLEARILVCHGEKDNFVPQKEMDAFKKQMDSVKADYTIKVYPGGTHAFTNPAATQTGKKFNMPIEYNAQADKSSWNDMKNFFAAIFK